MNNITIAGQLGRDSEIRALPDGTPVCSFSVADSQGRGKPSIWWNCSLFGKRGESLQQYLIKGQAVAIAGNVTEREWTDKEGHPRKTMDIRVSDIALLGSKPQGEPRQPAKAPKAAPNGFDDFEDTPF